MTEKEKIFRELQESEKKKIKEQQTFKQVSV